MSKFIVFTRQHGLSLGLIVLTIIYASGIPSIKSLFDEGLVGTKFLPQLLVVITLFCLVIIMLRDIRTADKSIEASEETARKVEGSAKPLALFVATLAYIALFKAAGFLIATFLFATCVLCLFSHTNKSLAARALIAAAITGLAYLLFAVAFGTHLNIYPVGF